jgi:hypothetical protein
MVVPTNRFLEFWSSHLQNFERFSHRREDIELLVIDDWTPWGMESLGEKNDEYLRSIGANYKIWSVREQEQYFIDLLGHRKGQEYFKSLIPHRTNTCRSFGYLIAYQEKPDFVVTLDDDNWAKDDSDFLGGHSIVGKEVTLEAVYSSTRWYNKLDLLAKRGWKEEVYCRGFPYNRRGERLSYTQETRRVVLNEGLWVGVPDLDAITILSQGGMDGIPKVKTLGLRTPRLMLGKGTFMPVSTQHVAFSPEVIPAYFDLLMNEEIHGLPLQRYDDIWSGAFLKKIADSIGDAFTVGQPLVEHRKVPRDVWINVRQEFIGMLVSQSLLEVVEGLEVDCKDYFEGYRQVVEGLRKSRENITKDREILAYFDRLFLSMERWLEVIDKL